MHAAQGNRRWYRANEKSQILLWQLCVAEGPVEMTPSAERPNKCVDGESSFQRSGSGSMLGKYLVVVLNVYDLRHLARSGDGLVTGPKLLVPGRKGLRAFTRGKSHRERYGRREAILEWTCSALQ